MQTSSAICRTPSSFPEVQLHTISSASDWPLAVRSVTSLLSEPLPRWVCRGPYPPTAPFAAYLIPELEAQTLATAAACSTDDNHTSLRLKETYNLIMSSCADLRTLASRSPMEPVLTKTITFGLVASLFRSCSRELSPRKYLKFVDGETAEFLLVLTVTNDDLAVSEEKLLPFVRSEPDREQGAVDIDASRDAIVIDGDNDGCVVDKNTVYTRDEDDGVPNADLDAMDEDEDDAMDEDEGIAGDLDTSEDDTSEVFDSSEDVSHDAGQYPVRRGSSWYDQGFFSESDGRTVRSCLSTQPSRASLEVPEHAHILGSSRPRAWVDIPVVCVAEAIDMPSVMSKVLYQRQIWGVKEPVVGIITCNRGLTVRVAIGWVEENETTAHVVTSSGHSDTHLGEYNLMNPLECMSFARFVCALERHVESMSASLLIEAKGSVYPSWGWTPEKSRISLGGNAYIEQWRLQVAEATHISVNSLCEEISCSRPRDLSIMAPKSSKGKATFTVDKSDSAPDSVQKSGKAQTATADSESAVTSSLTVPETHTTRISNSKRCERGQLSTEKGGTVIESLFDRNIYIIPHVLLVDHPTLMLGTSLKSLIPFIGRIITTYRSDTEPLTPKWIEQKETIASSDIFLNKYYQELCDDTDLKTLHKTLSSAEEISLKNRLPSLAQCCDLARVRDDLDDTRGANEVERRQAWDMLAVISHLVAQSQSRNSIDVMLERGLNFPSNPASKDLEKYKVDQDLLYLQAYTNRLSLLQQLCSALEMSARRSKSAIEKSDGCLAQCEAWTDVMKILYDRAFAIRLVESPTYSFYSIMRDRCARESLMGISDTTLVVPCPNVGRMIHDALFKALRKRNPNMEGEEIFELSVDMMEDFLLVMSPAPSHKDKSQPKPVPRRPNDTVEKLKRSKPDDPTKKLPVEDGKYPKVSLPNALRNRISAALNPLAVNCGAKDGLPKYRHTTEPSRSVPTISLTLDEEFARFIDQYIASGKEDLKKSNQALTLGERVLRLNADLILPLLTLEYKKADDRTIQKASNQSLTYLAAVMKFFELIGIYNHPSYSLVTNGNHGALFVSMSCQEEVSGTTGPSSELKSQALILEWNVRTYDVASMTDVYHLSVLMQKLAQRGEELKEKFTKKLLPAFLQKVEADPDILKWSMLSQLSKEEKQKRKAKIVKNLAKRQAGLFDA